MGQICSTGVQGAHYAKNDSVFHNGAEAVNMYFIKHGALVYRFSSQHHGKQLVKLEVPQWFSENTLWIPWRHCGKMKGLSDCETIALNASKFWEVTSKTSAAAFVLCRDRAIEFAARVKSCQV